MPNKLQLKLESGIAPPERSLYDFAKMRKGQSFAVAPADMPRVRNAAYAFARRTNRKGARDKGKGKQKTVAFSCRRMTATSWRIFRIE